MIIHPMIMRPGAAAANIITNGLELRLEFENNLNDTSGNSRSALWQGSSSYASGHSGYAAAISNDNTVYAPYFSAMDSANFTVCAWVKFNSVSGLQNIFRRDGEVAPNPRMYLFRLNGGKLEVYFIFSGLPSSTGATLTTNTWYHLALVVSYSGGSTYGQMYLNGATTGGQVSASGSMPTGAIEMNIGAAFRTSEELNGLIDDARLYSRALSGSEIASIAAGNG